MLCVLAAVPLGGADAGTAPTENAVVYEAEQAERLGGAEIVEDEDASGGKAVLIYAKV